MPAQRTPVLVAAAAMLGLESVVAAIFGVRDVVLAVPGGASAIGPALFLVVYAAVLALLTRAVALGRRWSRGPTVAFQVLHLPIAWFFRVAEPRLAAGLLALISIAVIACLVSRPATAVFLDEEAL